MRHTCLHCHEAADCQVDTLEWACRACMERCASCLAGFDRRMLCPSCGSSDTREYDPGMTICNSCGINCRTGDAVACFDRLHYNTHRE